MKTRHYSANLVPVCLALMLLTSLPQLANAQIGTNWIAFNDHRGTTNTSPLATTNEMGAGANFAALPTTPLRDFLTGGDLEATFYVDFTGSPDNFGANQDPNPGTPAYNLFNGICDVGSSPGSADGDGIPGMRADQGSTVTLVFTNLNPIQRYKFRGTSVRGNNYVNRWAVYTIQGAESFTDAHVIDPGTNNLLTLANFPSATLTNGQVALNSGENRAGSLVGWDEISPGPDGSFSILEEQYIGPTPYGATTPVAGAPYGYGICAMMLLEVGSPLPVTIVTQPPATVNVLEQRPLSLSVSVQAAPLPTYQWHKVGVGPIAGATKRTYAVTNANFSDAGDYFVVVANSLNTLTSTVSSVTVQQDTFPPRVLSIVATAGGTNLLVTFDEALNELEAADPFTYKINGVGAALAELANPSTVSITAASAFEPCVRNELEISNLSDLFNQTLVSTTLTFTASVVLMQPGDNLSWRFNQDGVELAAGWQAPGFNDSTWTAGTQLFDAKIPDRVALPNGVAVATRLNLTNEASVFTTNDLPTYYLRTHFNLPSAPQGVTRLRARLLVDDGAVLFLNGIEFYRQGVIPGTAFAAYCNGNIGDAGYQDIVLPTSGLLAGDNLLAVELKNNSATSSDVTFGLELTADLSDCGAAPPRLDISQSGNQITITWSATGALLERATSINGTWAPVAGATSPYVTGTTGSTAFYRLSIP